jgi:NADH-quinone oxidoreductase subunit G
MSATADSMTQEDLVNIEIDGRPLKVRRGAMIIEAADNADIPIPRFCYHKKLSIAANCRMCLIQVEKVPKPLPACATPVTEGMKVYTKSPMAIEAQRGTMEFLLINHPLDCPICDQGGECDLQELSLGYGRDYSEYSETKRVVKDKDIGPLISTEMTRCIHCTRCVRFGEEIAGIKELGATGRGEHMSIGTYIEKAITSEMSGNVIDLCPVGALTSKPFRFTARTWEMNKHDAIAPHDCIGSNLYLQVRNNEVMRVDPRENEQINEVWISDRDRFSYEALNSNERLRVPMIRKKGQWQETDWNTALEFTINGLKSVISSQGIGQFGTLVSPSSTVEEMHLAQLLTRGLGSANIDHRLRQLDFDDQNSAPVFPWLGQSIEDLEHLDAALLIGSNVRKEQPIVAHRLRKSALEGAQLMVVNPIDFEFNFPVVEKQIASPASMEHALAGIARAAADLTGKSMPGELNNLLNGVNATDTQKNMAERLNKAEKATILLGNLAHNHPAFSALRTLAEYITDATGATFGYLTEGANSAGAWIAGVVPHRNVGGKEVAGPGLNARSMFESPLKAYLLLNIEPEFDCADPATAVKALDNADFVVSLTPFRSNVMEQYADVLLPVAPFSETSGTYVNVEGLWQSFSGAVKPLGESRPAWKVLRVLGNFFELDGFDYVSSEEVKEELADRVAGLLPSNTSQQRYSPGQLSQQHDGLMRIADVPIYAGDNIVRRAASLQRADAIDKAVLCINETTAQQQGIADATQVVVKQGEYQVILPLSIDDRIPDGCVLLSAAVPAATGMGIHTGPVTIARVGS